MITAIPNYVKAEALVAPEYEVHRYIRYYTDSTGVSDDRWSFEYDGSAALNALVLNGGALNGSGKTVSGITITLT